MIKLKYRPEIDFLRAVAVGAVIVYHAKIYILGNLFLPGGFLGVDIFFVISGYLISSLIFQELDRNRNFSFLNFYERRARRILPALIFVIIVCLPFSWMYILPTSFIDFAKSILFSLGFSSNIYFYITGLEYGAESGLLKPLLHTWSLAVEEQFYLFFPLIFLFIFKFFYKFKFQIIALIITTSLSIAIYFSILNSSLNFYFIFSRIWEILAGTLIYFLERSRKNEITNFKSNLFVSVGILLIFLSFILITSSDGHPNLKTLIPILSVCLIIYFSKEDTAIVKFISNKLFTSIGLISYSLYLWHYPIFSFSRIGYLTKNIYHEILVVIIIFLLSVFTYFFIEKPFRSNKKISLKNFLFTLFLLITILIIFSISVISNKGYTERFPLHGKYNLDNLKYTEEVRIFKYEAGSPKFLENNNKKKVLVFGNSHGRDFFNMFYLNKKLFSEYQFSMLDGQVHCLINITKKKLCDKKLTDSLYKNFQESEYFVISQNWSEKDLKSLDKITQVLKKHKKKIILTSQHPEFYFKNSRTILDEFYLKNKKLPDLNEKKILETKKYNSESIRTKNINKYLYNYTNKNRIKYLNKKEFLCNFEIDKCYILTDENDKIHLDAAHLTLSGAKYFGKKIYSLNWLDLN